MKINNFFLNTKFKDLIKIVFKLKKIIININSKNKIKNKINVNNWNSMIELDKNSILNTEKAIEISYYILKLIEKIIEDLIVDKNRYKSNTNLKEIYRKVYINIERQNYIKKAKLQLFMAKNKLEERNKKIYEKINKERYESILKRRILGYEDKINEKILLKKKLAKKKEKKNINKYEESKKWFSFS